jgi:hypothetical protein
MKFLANICTKYVTVGVVGQVGMNATVSSSLDSVLYSWDHGLVVVYLSQLPVCLQKDH